ncbi:MAG: acetylglutamate kinase [Gaiellaceae bacterium]
MARIVVKCGGAASELRPEETILPLHVGGDAVCVVHGAGPQISEEMERRGLEVRFVEGRRYTSPETLEVVRDSFAEVNTRLLTALGSDAVGMMGDEAGLQATKVDALGQVGEPVPSAPAAIVEALEAGQIPVVTPLAEGPLNVNADDAAAALAVGLQATRLVFLTDVPGVLVDGEVAPTLEAASVEDAVASGEFEGGIVPKLRAAAFAAGHGIRAEIGATKVIAAEKGASHGV